MSCGVCISVSTEEDDDDDGGGLAMTDIGRESSSTAIVGACNFIFFTLLQGYLFVCFVLWGGVVVVEARG